MANSEQKQAQADRTWDYVQGNNLSNQYDQEHNNAAGQTTYFGDRLAEVNDPRLAGNGGYTAQQSQDIQQNPAETAAMTTGDEFGSNQFSDEERAAIAGDTNQWAKYYDPNKALSDQNNTAAAVGQDINKSDVEQSAEANKAQQMTPEEQQNIVTGAGITAGTGYRAQEDALSRAAAQSGVTDPVAVAAMKSRMEQQSAAASGDAMTQARIGASNAAAQRAKDAESQRMTGASTYSGQKSQADLALGSQQQGVNQFNTTAGMNLSKGQEQANVDRQTLLAGNRQATNESNQAAKFSQGTKVAEDTSGQAKSVADAALSEKDKGAQSLQDQQTMQNSNDQNAQNRQVAVYGTEGGLANQATGTNEQASQNPALWQKIAGAAAGVLGAIPMAHGAIVTQPTNALIGEAGPEMVVPLNDDPQSQTQQMMDKVSAQSQNGTAPAAGPTGNAYSDASPLSSQDDIPTQTTAANYGQDPNGPASSVDSTLTADPQQQQSGGWRNAAKSIAGGINGFNAVQNPLLHHQRPQQQQQRPNPSRNAYSAWAAGA